MQTMDIDKCFGKLWEESSISSLYETWLGCAISYLLFWENKNGGIAVKSNNSITSRNNVKNEVMQGSVWGGLKRLQKQIP